MKPLETYKPHDVVVIPFPFTDNIAKSKRRPAVVLSNDKPFNSQTHQLICAMITSSRASWPHDTLIHDLDIAGLPLSCVIRMKLFTIDQRFILRKTGSLSKRDSRALGLSLKTVLGLK